jgi:integrase
MLPHCSHITHKRGIYYFRRRMPQPCAFEICISLSTRDYREARWLAGELASVFDRTLAGLASMHPEIVAFLRSRLAEQLRSHRRALLRTPFVPSDHRRDHTVRDRDAQQLDSLADMHANHMSTLQTRDVRPAMPAAKRFAAEFGLPDDPDSLAELSLGLVQLARQVNEQRQIWLKEGIIDQIGPEFQLPVAPPAPPVAQSSGPLFSELLTGFVEYMGSTKSWTGQTLAQNSTSFRMFIEVCGDLPVSAYTKKHTVEFYDVLRKLPRSYSRDPSWAGKPLCDIAAASDGVDVQKLTMKTVQRHFTALGKFFEYLRERDEYTEINPAYGFKFPKPKVRANEHRKEWKGDKLAKLFGSPVWAGCASEARRATPGNLIIKDAKYWLPLLALYHGNRLEEFAQLRLADVAKEDGIWFLRIHDEDANQLKNPQSVRRVPLHPELKAAFLLHVHSLAVTPESLIFSELRPGGPDNKLGFYFSKWFGNYRKSIGLYEPLLDYHSLRHSFTTRLFSAGVDGAVVDALTGHQSQGISSGVYMKELPLKALLLAISKVSYPELEPQV